MDLRFKDLFSHAVKPMLACQLVTDWSVVLCVIDFGRESRTCDAIGINDLDVNHIAVGFAVNFVAVKPFNCVTIQCIAITVTAFHGAFYAAAFVVIETELRTVKLEEHMCGFAVGCKMQTAIAVFKKANSALVAFLMLREFVWNPKQAGRVFKKATFNAIETESLMDSVFVADLEMAVATVDKPFLQIFTDKNFFRPLAARCKQKQQYREIQNLILHSA